MSKFFNYVGESFQELTQKVSWPTWTQLTQSTVVVIGASLFITALVWIMDTAIGFIMDKFYSI
jgi:preprotein translocase subunit SecE